MSGQGDGCDAGGMSGSAQGQPDLLRRGLSLLDVPDAERVASILERYLAEIAKWNPRFGLVKAEGDELIIKHALDSLSAWRIVRDLAGGAPLDAPERAGGAPGRGGDERAAAAQAPESGRGLPGTVLDVGSGAGFPGIPLAVALPHLSFTLMERSAKRSAFLKNCVVLLDLANVRVVEADLRGGSGEFDVATFRAFAPLDRFFLDLRRARVRCRAVVAYKGRMEKAREEIEGIRALGLEFDAEIQRVEVPFMAEERHIVWIRLR